MFDSNINCPPNLSPDNYQYLIRMQRTNKQIILMSISFGTAVAILPFVVYRLLQHDWLIALIDVGMVIGMVLLGSYVYFKRETSRTSIMLALLALGGTCAVVYLKGPVLVYWVYPTMVGMYFILQPRLAVVFCGLAVLILLPILLTHLEAINVVSILVTIVINNVLAYIFATGMHRQGERLVEISRQDPLTGVGNRRALSDKLNEVLQANKRTPQQASLIMLDVDHFKRINDNHGHGAGDQVLINMARLISRHIRVTDRLYRFGGEEFVILATDSDISAARSIAEKLRIKVAEEELIDGQVITVSQGVAAYAETELADDWLDRADKALYQAKGSGRNVVCCADNI